MASKNLPVLFPACPPGGPTAQGLPLPSPPLASASGAEGRETWPLVHALASTLDGSNPLPALTEVLGNYFGARACLLLCHYPSTQDLVYTLWHQGGAAVSQRLSGVAESPLDWQRRVALGLIRQTCEQREGQGQLHWQRGLSQLLRTGDSAPAWLRTTATCTAIAVDGAGLQGAIVLLGSTDLAVEPAVQLNLASLGAIAFHQHFLQGQTQHHAEQLRYLQYLKEDFLSTLNHELRTPLTSMMLAIRMLRRPDLTSDRSALYLDILEQQCNREIALVNDLLMLQTLQTRAPAPVFQPTDLGQVISAAIAQGAPQFQQAAIALRWQAPSTAVTLATDPDCLAKVLHELLGNACKYSAPQTAVTVALAEDPTTGAVTVQITNLGAAIEAEDLPLIFDRFRRGRNATKDGIAGTGTGLALVKGILAQMGGTIAVSSQPGDNQLWQTCFTLAFERHGKST